MSEMIETVAKAIGDTNICTPGDPFFLRQWIAAFFVDDYPTSRERDAAEEVAERVLHAVARAAIAPLRSPTKAMESALAVGGWRPAIDEALR